MSFSFSHASQRILTAFMVLLLSLTIIAALSQPAGPLTAQSTFATNTPQAAQATQAPTPPALFTPLVSTVSVISQTANVRSEPGTDATVLTQVSRGNRFPVLLMSGVGRDLWYLIALPDRRAGWLHTSTAQLAVVWRKVAKTFDGVEMVQVPPGCFPMGSDSGEPDEQPVHQQCFDKSFWIDRYEVTNRRYGSEGYFPGPSRPRDSVNWFDAVQHCAERGGRLPTEAEWEYAARGPNAPTYPWGNTFINDNAISSWQVTARQTEAVGSRPGGVSWVGAFDMSGNVWEWTSSIYQAYPYRADEERENPDDTKSPRVVRGGSCCSYVIADVRASFRFAVDPYTEDANIGFRCVLDNPPTE